MDQFEDLKMHFLHKIRIFHPAMLVYLRVTFTFGEFFSSSLFEVGYLWMDPFLKRKGGTVGLSNFYLGKSPCFPYEQIELIIPKLFGSDWDVFSLQRFCAKPHFCEVIFGLPNLPNRQMKTYRVEEGKVLPRVIFNLLMFLRWRNFVCFLVLWGEGVLDISFNSKKSYQRTFSGSNVKGGR